MKTCIHELAVSGRVIEPRTTDSIIAGSAGVDYVRLTLETPDDWTGLALEVVMQGCSHEAHIKWRGDGDIAIPPKCITRAGGRLYVWLVGTYRDGVRETTKRMNPGIPIVEGAPNHHHHDGPHFPRQPMPHQRALTNREMDEVFGHHHTKHPHGLSDKDLHDIFSECGKHPTSLADVDMDAIFGEGVNHG